MLFSDIPLFDAIYRVREEMASAGEDVGTDYWLSDEAGRFDITQRVMRHLINDVDQKVIDAWKAFRKNGNIEPGIKKLDLVILVARVHGTKCFYANRGRGACSEDVNLDRIIPGSRGGKYTLANCVLACGLHNRMRGDLTVEEFLQLAHEIKATT